MHNVPFDTLWESVWLVCELSMNRLGRINRLVNGFCFECLRRASHNIERFIDLLAFLIR